MILNSHRPDSIDSRIQILSELFSAPHNAFEFYLNDEHAKKSDILRIHFSLWLIAPISKIVSNLTMSFIGSFTTEGSFSQKIFSGTVTSFIVYPVVLFIIVNLDALRVYYKKINRVENEVLPPPDLLLLSFIPFSASSIFWILPVPLNFFFISIAFFYSIQLSFYSLQNVSNYGKKEFLNFILVSLIFLLTGGIFVFGILNIIRIVLN